MRFEAPGIGVSTDAPSQAPRTRSWFLPFMEAAAHILVASDVHGRIPMLVRVAFEYQRHFQRKVEAILVSGDLGIWPRDEQLDSSTAKRSRTDPEELGFRAFGLQDELGPGEAARTLGVHVNTFVPDPKTNRLRPNSLGVITVRSGRAPTFEFAPETFLRRLTAKSWYTVD